eukprot:2350865-Amphidinium_carterae.1
MATWPGFGPASCSKPQAGSKALLHKIQSSCSSPVGEVWLTSLKGRLTWPPQTRSMGKLSGSKFQSPRIKICLPVAKRSNCGQNLLADLPV